MGSQPDDDLADNAGNGFLLPWLAATIGCIAALVAVGYISFATSSFTVFVLGVLVLLAVLIAAGVTAGKRHAWNHVCGVVAGALTGTGLLFGWIFYMLSHMQIGGF